MKWAMIITMLFVMVGSAMAADTISSILTDNTNDYPTRPMDVRYDALQCNIEYTIGRIDAIKEYTNDLNANIVEDLLDDKDELENDSDGLKDVYDEDNLTAFNKYITDTLDNDYDNAVDNLNDFENEYTDYINNNDRDEFLDALIDVKDEHADCIADALDNNTNNDTDDDTNDDDDDTDDDDTTDYVGRSLDLRYENLVCKIDFTVGQIDIIKEYANDLDAAIIDELLDDKEELVDDKAGLKDVYDDKDLSKFNKFVNNTLHPDFVETMDDLKEFKEDYKEYIDEEDREDFKDALTELRDEYKDCTNTQYRDMSKLMDQYYKHKGKMWDQIIKSMYQRGLTTSEMEDAKELLDKRLAALEDAVDSGDMDDIKEQLALMKEEYFSLWAKFHSGRLNSYLNRIEPAANKYGRSDDVEKIRNKLGKYSGNGHNNYEAWNDLKESAKEMREMGKDMLKQGMGRGRNR